LLGLVLAVSSLPFLNLSPSSVAMIVSSIWILSYWGVAFFWGVPLALGVEFHVDPVHVKRLIVNIYHAIISIMPKLPYDMRVILQCKLNAHYPHVQNMASFWTFLFACYETHSQRTALDEIYSFKQRTGELAVSL
jgi:hypothetical protein